MKTIVNVTWLLKLKDGETYDEKREELNLPVSVEVPYSRLEIGSDPYACYDMVQGIEYVYKHEVDAISLKRRR